MEWNTHVENKTIVGNLNTWSEEIRYISKHLVYKFFVAKPLNHITMIFVLWSVHFNIFVFTRA